jgi:hypothetical protein
MAKMFYTIDETKAALGKSEDQVKQLASEGRLREFRDGNRLMFKADQVENLKAELTNTDEEPLELTPDDSGIHLSISDKDSSGSAAGLPLVDTASGTKAGSTAGGTAAGSTSGVSAKEDTALASDLGLSGSISGMPSSGRAAGPAASHSGIDVFQPDDTADKSDPSAQTSIAPGISPAEQINIESVGSGSGLLDLTRESDDTSLGAVLDGIGPAVSGRREPVETIDSSAFIEEEEEDTSTARVVAAPVRVEKPDPWAPAFGGAALAAGALLMVGIYVLLSAMAGSWPELTQHFDKDNWIQMPLMGLGAVVLFFIIGLIIGMVTTKRRA